MKDEYIARSTRARSFSFPDSLAAAYATMQDEENGTTHKSDLNKRVIIRKLQNRRYGPSSTSC